MPNIIIKNEYGEDELYEGVNTVRFLNEKGSVVSYKYDDGEVYSRAQQKMYRVRFRDYDGFVLKEIYVDSGDAVRYPEVAPSREGYTFVGWTWSEEDLSVVTSHMDVHALYSYEAASTTMTFVRDNSSSSTINIYMYSEGANVFEFDWGDGSTSTSTRTSAGRFSVSHTYATDLFGTIVVTVTRTSGTAEYTFGYNSISATSFQGNSCFGTSNVAWGRRYLKHVKFASDISVIGGHSFTGCYALQGVDLPPSVVSIARNGFYSCESLQYVMISPNLQRIDQYCFYDCNSLTTIALPSTLTVLGAYSFYNCRSLDSLTIPDSVNDLGSRLCHQAYGLKTIRLPQQITTLPEYVLYHCFSLREVTIPAGVTSIEQYALTNLTNAIIRVPSSVLSISNYSLNSSGSSQVYMEASEPPTITSNTFSTGSSNVVTIHVPAHALDAYRSQWSTVAEYIVGDL